MIRTLANLLSPAGKNGRLSILIFHRVVAQRDPVFDWHPDAIAFERRMQWLRTWFHVLPLDEAVLRLREQSLPARAAAVSFDDGYADNYHVALPILQRLGVPATFFVATGYINGGRMWNDTITEAVRHCGKATLDLSGAGLGTHDISSAEAMRRTTAVLLDGLKYKAARERSQAADYVAQVAGCRLPADLMMTSEQVRAMRRAGMLIGAHTVTHPILARLDPDEARREVVNSRDHLEDLLQDRVGLFAYPNGRPSVDYRAEDAESVRGLGFDAAVTTAWGVADAGSDRMQLPRFTPWDGTRLRFGVRLLRNLLDDSRRAGTQIAS
ncbi:MAG: polysaccharide deacetylase family protein [Candidatus Accumulibacter sp.]|jgi:peptidoglycan/xylan/chitin deacetylase (PgdA/CDA1 family)|nr:polysaccharide deacetylase family protein [Candidatus Accumulibacter conexus]